ncbi:ABC transporter permease [Nocardioides sp. B-3]|uniref:ABC transporter permease n=1 Tax=Nocardioides sp. B-3 TaxID=2895565 RepID=UPI002152134E|nr:ABC transporter permease [Nocardioides sp. B-3]UUZ59409.1 ABC transporter permease [Nocardioides sp. B-3]
MRRIALRAGELLGVLFIVSFGVFMLVTLMPGDPAVAILGEGHPRADYEALRQELGLYDPLLTRYWDWLSSAVTGDLGRSLVPPQTEVSQRILGALPVSVQLAVMGLLIALVPAIPLAMWSAAHAGGTVDRIISAAMFAVLSVPSFPAGLLLIMVFSNGLGWFPRAQWVRISDGLPGNLHHALLPAIVIALMELALFTRILRNDLIITLNEDYILAARAKGMPPRRIPVGDALRPSSFSLVTLMGISPGRLIGSTVIVEYLFALPGMGSMIVAASGRVTSARSRGAVLVIALAYVVINTFIDLSYGYPDPRTRRVHV